MDLIPEATNWSRGLASAKALATGLEKLCSLGLHQLVILVPEVSSEEIFPSLPKWMSVLENLQAHMATNLIFMLDPFES